MTVGARALAVVDEVQGARVPAWLWYPATAAAVPTRLGPFMHALAEGAAPADAPPGGFPVIAISHGTGGTPWGYRGLASALVDAGFAVLLLAHPGNWREDNALADTDANLANRPRHVARALAVALADPAVPLDAARVGGFGHSLGGYTLLAAAGGHPLTLPAHVPHAARLDPTPELARLAYAIETTSIPALRAVALHAPALGWFLADGALADVRAAIFVRACTADAWCPPDQIARALRSLPADVAAAADRGEVAGANHFACLAPYPPELARPDLPPSQDPPGFDRAAYQRTLARELAAFFAAALA